MEERYVFRKSTSVNFPIESKIYKPLASETTIFATDFFGPHLQVVVTFGDATSSFEIL